MKLNEISFSSESLVELIRSAFAKNSSFRFKVSGFSMSCFIKDGDIVTISPLSVSQVGFGKSVAFIRPDIKKLVIHRIIGQNNGCFITKGDNSIEIDGLIPKENILGCVTKIERGGRAVRLGLGPERLVVAFLSKNGILPFMYRCWRLIPFPARQALKRL